MSQGRYRAIVAGSVQGVGFRMFTLRAAERFEVKGYVRNTCSRGVEVEAEGDEERLRGFFETIKQGPSLAEVEDIQIERRPELAGYSRFEIR